MYTWKCPSCQRLFANPGNCPVDGDILIEEESDREKQLGLRFKPVDLSVRPRGDLSTRRIFFEPEEPKLKEDEKKEDLGGFSDIGDAIRKGLKGLKWVTGGKVQLTKSKIRKSINYQRHLLSVWSRNRSICPECLGKIEGIECCSCHWSPVLSHRFIELDELMLKRF